MRRFARRLSQIAKFNTTNHEAPSEVLSRPSVASIFNFDDDEAYFRSIGLRTQPPVTYNSKTPFQSVASKIAKQRNRTNSSSGNISQQHRSIDVEDGYVDSNGNDDENDGNESGEFDDISILDSSQLMNMSNLSLRTSSSSLTRNDKNFTKSNDNDDQQNEKNHKNHRNHRSKSDRKKQHSQQKKPPAQNRQQKQQQHKNQEQFARTARFMSIMYAIVLFCGGVMCTAAYVNKNTTHIRDIFLIVTSVIGFSWLLFLHYDIFRYKKWALQEIVAPMIRQQDNCIVAIDDNDDPDTDDADPDADSDDDYSDTFDEEDCNDYSKNFDENGKNITVDDAKDDDKDEEWVLQNEQNYHQQRFYSSSSSSNKRKTVTVAKRKQGVNFDDAYDTLSLNTAMIFDYIQKPEVLQNHHQRQNGRGSVVKRKMKSITNQQPSSSINNRLQKQKSIDSVSMNSIFTSPVGDIRSVVNDDIDDKDEEYEEDEEENEKDDEIENGEQINCTEEFHQAAYRFFQGKHSNDFYLKIGIIIFCFGSIINLGINIVQQIYFFAHHHNGCADVLSLTADITQTLLSFYQLFIVFKYSNIIINRYKNVARFATMHLLGLSLALWIDTIIREVIEDSVTRELNDLAAEYNRTVYTIDSATNTTTVISIPSVEIDESDIFNLLEKRNPPFKSHILHEQNCSHLAIVNNESMAALPYLYPFTIEFNVAVASIWYMIWINIGKINDNSLFHSVAVTSAHHGKNAHNIHEDDDDDEETKLYRRSVLSMNVDCHSSSRGLFFGLAFLLVIITTLVIFFSTIKKDIYTHFGVYTYSLQISSLILCSFLIIPIAYVKIQQLDLIDVHHRDNAFTIMDDILVLIPVPFFFVHYTLDIVANILVDEPDETFQINNILISIAGALTTIQVMCQSPFIVDGLRRCANNNRVRYRKPGRELIIFSLILNVTLWILNTFELKSVELYQAPNRYFGEFTSIVITHITLPLMLFYRFHSSVCLSNIWKYAYEKDV